MLSQELIMEYENCLLGKSKNIPPFYFAYDSTYNMQQALAIMKYAFEVYLRSWTPIDLRENINKTLLDKLKLTGLLKYIIFPPELDPQQDYFFIVWSIYPYTIDLDKKDLILKVYKEMMTGKIKRYPKEFFTGIPGLVRAGLCLQYAIEQNLPVSSIKELYRFFSTPTASTFLRKNKLYAVYEDSFENPLAYLHYALPSSQKDETWYYYYTFIYYYQRLKGGTEQ